MSGSRLAVLTTHPIQYHATWFRALAAHPGIDLSVFFCHQATRREQAAAGFGVEFDWDVPLLDGYPYRFLKNLARSPAVKGFGGLDTPEINEIIQQRRFDAVLVNGWHYKSAWQALQACRRTNTPVMARSDSHLHTTRHLVKRVGKWPFYRWFIPKLDACLAVGKWSREYFLHYGAKPDRVFIVPHMIDYQYLAGRSARLVPLRSVLRAYWELEESATIFLFAGKFIAKKRPMDFLRAMEVATKQGANAAGLMVGDGPLRARCEEFVRSKDLPVRFAGFLNQSEIPRSYVASDALVLPSDETWGLVVDEAMACGRPCFVSDQVGCGPDMIVPDKTGVVFPLGDINQLAMLITSHSKNPGLLLSMGLRAQQRAQQQSVERAVGGVIEAISAVAT